MFHATAGDAVRELARSYIAHDGSKAYGIKAFAKRVCPLKSDDQAYTRLMNCTAADTADKFSDEEWMAIIRIGHEQGRHFVADHFLGGLYEIKPRTTEEFRQRRKAYRRWLLEELKRCEEE